MKLIAVAFLLLAALTNCYGQSRPRLSPYSEQLLSLKGLPGIGVFIDGLSPNIQKAGLRAADLKIKVEELLKNAKINVLPEGSYNLDEGAAFLYVQVNDLTLPGGRGYALTLKIELFQSVTITRPDAAGLNLRAPTWTSLITMYSPPRVRENVGKYLTTLVREFVDAYWFINAKEKRF